MKRSWIIALVPVLLVSIVVPAAFTYAKAQKAGTHAVSTVAELGEKYHEAGQEGTRIKILIVPGHEPGFGGTEYKGVYEREITVDIADQLAEYLRQNPRFDIVIARSDEAWNDDLSKYFDNERRTIQTFVKNSKKAFTKLVKRGKVEERSEDDQVAHATAPNDVALRLYGINKWANENNVDLVVHLHVNDAPDHEPDEPGANSGFAVYVPDSQYANASTSLPLGAAIATRIAAMNATSTLPVEDKGVVEDQELIALGAYNTLSVPSVLIEYGYITEPRFRDSRILPILTKDYAFETYLGVLDFFKDSPVTSYPSASLPFTFTRTSLGRTGTSTPGTYALQAALHTLNVYPAYPSIVAANVRLMAPTLTTCPIDGVMGVCTTSAIKAFQASKGLETTGALGPKTTAELNAEFSSPR